MDEGLKTFDIQRMIFNVMKVSVYVLRERCLKKKCFTNDDAWSGKMGYEDG